MEPRAAAGCSSSAGLASYSPPPLILLLASVRLQGAVGLWLPPLLSAVLQVASTAAMAATNPAHCASVYVRHAQAAAHMSLLYRWLEPLVAPLEPLLWLAGVGAAQPQRRCLCGEAAHAAAWGSV